MTFCVVAECDGRATITVTANLDKSLTRSRGARSSGRGIEF